MPITIGGQSLATTRPADLDEKLVATTGCTAAEHRAILAKNGTPFQIARALKPMLADDQRSVGDLATAIGAEDKVFAVRLAVVALLAPPSADTIPPTELA